MNKRSLEKISGNMAFQVESKDIDTSKKRKNRFNNNTSGQMRNYYRKKKDRRRDWEDAGKGSGERTNYKE